MASYWRRGGYRVSANRLTVRSGAPLAIGMVLFAVGLVIAGLAPSMLVLVFGRVVQGLGQALCGGCVRRHRPRLPRIAASANARDAGTAWVVPGFIGPLIGAPWPSGSLARDLPHDRPAHPTAALLTLPAIFRLGPPAGAETKVSRLPAALRLASGAGLALAGVATGNVYLAPPLISIGIVFAFPALRSLLPEGTLRARHGVPAAIAGNGFLNMAFFSADAFIPYLLTSYRGYSTFIAGLSLTSATISWTAGSWLQERLAEKLAGRREPVRRRAGYRGPRGDILRPHRWRAGCTRRGHVGDRRPWDWHCLPDLLARNAGRHASGLGGRNVLSDEADGDALRRGRDRRCRGNCCRGRSWWLGRPGAGRCVRARRRGGFDDDAHRHAYFPGGRRATREVEGVSVSVPSAEIVP